MSLIRLLRILVGRGQSGTELSSDTSARSKPNEKSTSARAESPTIGGRADASVAGGGESLTRDRSSSSDDARWVEPGEVVTVAGRAIPGMVYLGSSSADLGRSWEGSPFIDPRLRVAVDDPDVAGSRFSYFPRYREIPPQARAAYLDWLADGRRDNSYGLGYVFLFFYGLERRFFVDSPPEDEKRILVAETERLLGIYGGNRSIQGYLGMFLDTARVVLARDHELEPHTESSGYGLPLGLQVAIGRMTKKGVPLSADWLLAWYSAHPDCSFRTPARRAQPEFKELFRLLFDERHPNGLKVRVSKRVLSAQYRASSGAFEVNLRPFIGDIPDISRLSQPLNAAKKIVDEATNALDRYSRFLGRNPNGRGTMEAHVLLPKCLWTEFPCPELEELRNWAKGLITSGHLPLIEEVIERIEGNRPEKVNTRQLTWASDFLARLSIGMAPDPRFALRKPRVGDPVVLFHLPDDTLDAGEVSEKFREVLIMIAMGSFVAGADGTVARVERKALRSMVESAELSDSERERLLANLRWMTEVPPDLAVFRRQLANVSENLSQEVGRVALAMAAVDDSISPREIQAIERLYGAIGLSTDGIYSALHDLTSTTEPVMVRAAADQNIDFLIPKRPDPDGGIVLNAERVAGIRSNTERVSTILGAIFREDDAQTELEETSREDYANYFGLDDRHADLVNELLTRPHWKESEFEALAGRFQLMAGGALETINEWSFERFDDVLIEEYEGYELNAEVVAELKD